METISQIDPLRVRIAQWRMADQRIALVPTMGNLHTGHLDLVRRAREMARHTVVSIFVNPLQFGPGEDFEAYPRTLDKDREKLQAEGVDLVFAPTAETVYPRGQEQQTQVAVPGISDILCGASRPGHFSGVATVVCKLFNIVQPDMAVFGEKDFQQLLVIRRMTRDLCLPVEIIGAPTVREADGLAMSSRNGYLSAEERQRAPALRQCLLAAEQALMDGVAPSKVEQDGLLCLERAGFRPDYLSVRRPMDLASAREGDTNLVVLAAAHLSRARLIDNLRVCRP